MAKTRIDSADSTDMSGQDYADMAQAGGSTYDDLFSVTSKDTDGATGLEETSYQPEWTKWHGYYRKIPEFSAVIDKLASWSVGRGYKADPKTMKLLRKLRGFGKDDFNSLLENGIRTALICGDSFMEVMRDNSGRLLNIKPLNSGSMRIIVDKYGIIKRYEQVAQIPTDKGSIKFDPKEIFHLSWNRIADEIHGIPYGEKIEDLIKMRNESMQDLKIVFHRYVKPILIISVDTDDETEIATFKGKIDAAYKRSENLIIPTDTVKGIERVSVPQYSTLDPLPWIKYLCRAFVTSCGVPEVIMGWGEETTEASSKVIYLAFQQTIERIQRYIEAQLDLQLGIEINLEFPASIEPLPEAKSMAVKSITTDQKKDSKLNKFGMSPNKDQK